MRTVFLNGDLEFKNRGIKSLEREAEVMMFYYKFNGVESDYDMLSNIDYSEYDTVEELQHDLDMYKELPPFHEYGLSFDFVEGDDEEDDDSYFRYQLSWGGPSDEIRFFEDGTIHYVFMDWFTGVGFDVTDDESFNWLYDYFEGCDMLNFESKREESWR